MHKFLPGLAVAVATVLLSIAGAVLVVVSGRIEVAASTRHSALTEWFFDTVRRKAVERQTASVAVPDLTDPLRLPRGERFYREQCALCHGLSGEKRSAVAEGLNPPPPDLSEGIPARDAAKVWWITRHGIRMTGMPAFGERLSEEEAWDLVAWLAARGSGQRR